MLPLSHAFLGPLSSRHPLPVGIKLICLVLFARFVGWGFIDPYLSLFVMDFGVGYTGVGVFFSLMYLVAIITVVPLLRLADRVKDARLMEDGEIIYLVVVLLFVLAGLFKSIPLLLGAFLLAGPGNSLIIVGGESYIRRHDSHSKKSTLFSFYTAIGYAGWILGILLGAFTFPYYGMNGMFLALLPGVLLGIWILPHIRERGVSGLVGGLLRYFHRGSDLKDLVASLKDLNPRSAFFLLITFFDGLITVFGFVFIPLFAVSVDLSLKQVALLMGLMHVPLIFSVVFTRLSAIFHRMTVMSLGLSLAGLSFAILFFVQTPGWIIFLMMLKSIAVGFMRPAYNSLLSGITPHRMLGQISGLSYLALTLGFAVGPFFSGLVSDAYGIRFCFLILAVLAGVLSLLCLILGSLWNGTNTLALPAVLAPKGSSLMPSASAKKSSLPNPFA